MNITSFLIYCFIVTFTPGPTNIVLQKGTLRNSEIKRLISGITQKMLTQQLRELEEYGLINRIVYPVVPPKVEYFLTEQGKSIETILHSMCQWGKDYMNTCQVEIENLSLPGM